MRLEDRFEIFTAGLCGLFFDAVLVVAKKTHPEKDVVWIFARLLEPSFHCTDDALEVIRPAPRHKMSDLSAVGLFQGVYHTALRSAISGTDLVDSQAVAPVREERADGIEVRILLPGCTGG